MSPLVCLSVARITTYAARPNLIDYIHFYLLVLFHGSEVTANRDLSSILLRDVAHVQLLSKQTFFGAGICQMYSFLRLAGQIQLISMLCVADIHTRS